MYAFLSRVFGRKKDDKDAPSSSPQPVLGPGELLGGRFEAISPNVSPAQQFLELGTTTTTNDPKDKGLEKDVGFSFFKGKWRPASPDVKPTRKLDVLPHLSLNFQEPRAAPAAPDLGLLFTTDQILSDAVIGQRRLNPLEALVLVQACSQAIIAKGLETLGIMHPHWYSASQGIQRRVISHFIYLLDLEKLTSIPSPVLPTSPMSAFETQVNDTLSPHDIAAILRWGLRHVQIEGDSLGTDDGWYKTFLEAESAAGYPPKAFSDKLAPLLPTTHLQLLTATLEIFSSLAAHAEINGTSGSKLCKIFGLWLLTAHRVEDGDDWRGFYARWERTGRMLEHLFLSRIRDESSDQRMPVRLLELVRKYPYTKGLSPPTTDLPLLSPPPCTTRLHDALFVRIEIELPYGKRKPASKLHPLSLLADAFSTKVEEGEYVDLWAKITTASKGGDSSSLGNIFTDDTVRFLSLVPDEPTRHEVRSPTFSLVSPVSPFKRSFSAGDGGDADKPEGIVAGHLKSATEPSTVHSPLSNGIGSDWTQFSTSGFLETIPNIIPLASTLLDTDIEKTIPPDPIIPLSRKSSRRSKATSPSPRRKSAEIPRPETEIPPETKPEDIEEQKNLIKASQMQIIQLDEAFVDFWSDSLLDPISADWPTFVICKFKSSLVPELTFGVVEKDQKQKTIQWLVLEQVYTIRTPPIPSIPIETARRRPSSPSSQSTSGRKRFSFWSVSRTTSGSSNTSHKGKKKEQDLKVGEMGELTEEEPKNETKGSATIKIKSPIFKSRKLSDGTRKAVVEQPIKSIMIKPAEEHKSEENTTVAVVTAAAVLASVTPVIASGFSTDGGSHPGEGVTVKTEIDHRTDAPAIEAESTDVVVPSSDVKNDDVPSVTTRPDVVSSLEAKAETEPLQSEILVPTTVANVEATEMHPESEVLQPKVAEVEPALLAAEGTTDSKDRSLPLLEPEVVEDLVETKDGVETDPITTTLATAVFVESGASNVADAPPVNMAEPVTTQDAESISVSPQHGAPLVSEIAISKPEIDTEDSVKPDSTSTTGGFPAASAPEVVPAAVDDTPLVESEGTGVGNKAETVELQPSTELKAIETEDMSSPVEETTEDLEQVTEDVLTSDTTLIHATAPLPDEVAAPEVSQPRSDAVPIDQAEDTTAPTKVERSSEAENIEAKDDVFKEEKHDSALPPALHEATDLQPEVKTEASAEPAPALIEQSLHTDIEPEATQQVAAEPQSEIAQETTAAQEIVSTSKDADEMEDKVTADTHGMDAPNVVDDIAAESTETEHVMLATEGDSTKHENGVSTEAVRLATAEDFPNMDKPEPEETVLEAQNDSVENGTTLHTEHQVDDDTANVVKDTIPDIQTSLNSDSTQLEPEVGLDQTEVESEIQIEASSVPTMEGVPINIGIQPDHPSLTEVAPNVQEDIEVQSRAVDGANDEPISKSDIGPHIEAIVRSGPEVDLVAPVVEEPSIITQVEGESLSGKMGSEVDQSLGETGPAVEDETVIEDQIVAPVDVQLEHAAPVEPSRTDEFTEVVPLSSVEESLETLVEPHETNDTIPEVDAVVHETPVLGESGLVSATEEPAAPVELNLEQETAANISQELPVAPEPEQSVTHEEAAHIPPTSPAGHEILPIAEEKSSIAVEVDSEPLSTDPAPEGTLDVEERHVLLASESGDYSHIESKDEIIPLATPEPEPEVVTTIVAPDSTPEVQAQRSVEETTEDVHAVAEDLSATRVPDTVPVISEPTIAAPEDIQIENGGTSQAEEDLVNVPPADDEKPVAPLVEFKATEIPSIAQQPLVVETAPVVSESAIAIPEGLQVENAGIAQTEENSVDPLPTDNSVLEEPIAPLTEFKEAVEIPPMSGAGIALVISRLATIEPEDVQIGNDDIAQAEEDLPLSTTTEPPVAEIASVISGPAAVVPEDLQIEDGGVAQVEEDLFHRPPPTDDLAVPHTEPKEAVEIPSEMPPVVSELTTVVPEDLHIENDSAAQTEPDLVDSPPPINDTVEEKTVAPLTEFKEVEIPSTAETPSVASESATVVPEDLHIENDGVTQTEPDLANPPPPIDDTIHQGVVEIPSTTDIASVVSEQPTAVPEDPHIQNDNVAQAKAGSIESPPPIDDTVQKETAAPLVESNDAVEAPSTTPVVSELATDGPEHIQIEHGSIVETEADIIDSPPPIDDPVQEKTTEIPSTADITSVVSEQATVVPEDPQIESDSVVHAETALTTPADDLVQESVTPLTELKETVEVPSPAEMPPVISELSTDVPEDVRIENDNVPQAEADSIHSSPPIDETTQEKTVTPPEEFKEVAEIPPVISEVTTVIPEDIQTENDSVAQAQADLVDPPQPIDDTVQEEAAEIPSTIDIASVVSEQAPQDSQVEDDSVAHAEAALTAPADDLVQENIAPITELKEAVEVPSTAGVPPVVSELATVVPEDIQIENDSVPRAEVDPTHSSPPIDDSPQEETVTPLEEVKAVEAPSIAEIPPVVSEATTVIPEDIKTESDSIAQPQADLVDPPPFDNIVQEKTVVPQAEFNEAAKTPSTADISSVISEQQVAPEDLQIDNDNVAHAEASTIESHPTLADDPVQESLAIIPELKDVVEAPSTTGTPPVASELATVVLEDIQAENDIVAPAEANLIHSLPPIDRAVQEKIVAPLTDFEEAVEIPSTVDLESLVSEQATVVPEDHQIENGSVAQTATDSIESPPPTDDPVQEETVAPVEVPSTVEIPPVVSELASVVPGDIHIENDSPQTEADSIHSPPPIDDSVQEKTVAPVEVPSTVEISPVVSEQATVIPEDLKIENDSVAQAEADSIDSIPPIDDTVQEKIVAPLTEVDIPSTVVSEQATIVPEDLQIVENGSVAQIATDSIESPPLTDDPVQEKTVALVEVPSTAEISPVVSELAPVLPEDIRNENDSVPQAKADSPLPIDDTAQEKTVTPLEEFKGVETHSTAEMSSVASEQAIVVPEDLRIENDSVAQAEADSIDSPPPIDETVQEKKGAVEIPSTADLGSVGSEQATAVPEDLQIENDIVVQTDLVDPPPLADDPIQEVVNSLVELQATDTFSTAEPPVIVSEPIAEDLQTENGSIGIDNTAHQEPLISHAEFKEAPEIPSTTEATEAEIASVVSELSTEVPENFPTDSGCIAKEDDLRTAETEPIEVSTEGKVIPETTVVEDTLVRQDALSEVETQSFEEAKVETPETHVSSDNKYSTTERETNGTMTDSSEVTSDNLVPEDIKAEPMVTEPMHHLNISPVTPEPPSTTD